MTAREVLEQIEQRADLNAAAIGNLRSLANHAKPNREAGQGTELVDRDRASALRCAKELRTARTDVPRLVAALRAVLDQVDENREWRRRFPGEATAISSEAVYRAITEALGADQ